MEEENQPITNVHEYFLSITEIWQAFANEKISVRTRDSLLSPYRAIIRDLPTSHP